MQIGVIIPLFNQAQYLIECVTSVLSQTLEPTGIVIVNDGCPNPSSDTAARAIAAAWPGQTVYVRQENRGLSGARNTGVRALLARWPEVEAILPLDADDWLEEYTLEAMASRIESGDRPDWVYPDMQRFGNDFKIWKPWPRLNPFRLVFENQCAAASLIRRRVFDAGLFYDETMRDGYEDWEFFLRALSRGFWGAAGGQVGFHYRVKKNSMVKKALKRYDQVVRSMRERHPALVMPWSLTACEHKYMPRFRFIDEQRRACEFSDPYAPSAWDQSFDLQYVPPITILGSAAVAKFLRRSGSLRGLLFSIQHDLRTHAWRIDLENGHSGLHFERHQIPEQEPLLLVFQSKWLEHGDASFDSIESIIATAKSLRIDTSDYGPMQEHWNAIDFAPLYRHACALARMEVESNPGPLEDFQKSSTWFAHQHNVCSFEATYPLTRNQESHVCFAVPFLGMGGVEQCVLNLALALRRSIKEVRIHLLLTESGAVEFDRKQLSMFDEIVSVAHCEQDKRLQVLSSIMRGMDIVVIAHSLLAYQALSLLPNRSQAVHRPFCVSYLHVIEVAADGRLSGYPYVALECESEIDCFLVSSESLRDFLINSGVNEERVRIGRNAPVVRPPTREEALLLADRKAAREFLNGRRFELLLAGSLDYEDDVARIAAFIRHADRQKVNLRLTIVGSDTFVDWPANLIRFVEVARDPATVARYLEDVDGIILLSRWEGVPPVLLDAMAHGCLVFATELGAVGEVAIDGVTGFLYPAVGSDEDIASAAIERVKSALSDPTGCRAVRRRATEAAMEFAWDEVAQTLNEFLVLAAQSRSTLSNPQYRIGRN
jgi:glycosyltransferase involved in cell wall biosynthesis